VLKAKVKNYQTHKSDNYDYDTISEGLEHLEKTGAILSYEFVEHLAPFYQLPTAI